MKTIPYKSISEIANELATKKEQERAKRQHWLDKRTTFESWLEQQKTRVKTEQLQDVESDEDDDEDDWNFYNPNSYSLKVDDWHIIKGVDEDAFYVCFALCLEQGSLSCYSRLFKLTIVSTFEFEYVKLDSDSIRNASDYFEELSLKMRAALLRGY